MRLKGVKVARAKGRVYYYHRKTMTRLPGEPGSAEFLAKLRALEARGAAAALPGTLGRLIAEYRASPEYATLAPRSKAIYQQVFDDLRPAEGMPLLQVDHDFLYTVRDGLGSRSRANIAIKTLRLVFNWGRRRGKVTDNPAATVELIRRPKTAPIANRPWTQQELDMVLNGVSPRLRLAVALAAYAGLRESDVVRVTWDCYDGQFVRAVSHKTGVPVVVPAHVRLRAILGGERRTSGTIIANAKGQPITTDALRMQFIDGVRRLGLTGLTFHGLRHTLGTQLAEAGANAATIAAVLGHRTLAMAEHYSRSAQRGHLAKDAITRLENGLENRPITC